MMRPLKHDHSYQDWVVAIPHFQLVRIKIVLQVQQQQIQIQIQQRVEMKIQH
jgi:hypothetical protein